LGDKVFIDRGSYPKFLLCEAARKLRSCGGAPSVPILLRVDEELDTKELDTEESDTARRALAIQHESPNDAVRFTEPRIESPESLLIGLSKVSFESTRD
jgi:hypothetical protein